MLGTSLYPVSLLSWCWNRVQATCYRLPCTRYRLHCTYTVNSRPLNMDGGPNWTPFCKKHIAKLGIFDGLPCFSRNEGCTFQNYWGIGFTDMQCSMTIKMIMLDGVILATDWKTDTHSQSSIKIWLKGKEGWRCWHKYSATAAHLASSANIFPPAALLKLQWTLKKITNKYLHLFCTNITFLSLT